MRLYVWRATVLGTLAEYRQAALRRARSEKTVAILDISRRGFTAAVARQIYAVLDAKLQHLKLQQLNG
ncbi:hypothetical protein V8E36_002256 [Tilletia maclaganii]